MGARRRKRKTSVTWVQNRRHYSCFFDAIDAEITPLMLAHGFFAIRDRSNEYVPRVTFRSTCVEAEISFPTLHHELNFKIGLLLWGGAVFTLNELLGSAVGENQTAKGSLQAGSEASLRYCVCEVARMLRSYGAPFLEGDAQAYRRVDEYAARTRDADAHSLELTRMRRGAHYAWKERDYNRIIDIFEAFSADLTPSERAKLAYARKRLPPKE